MIKRMIVVTKHANAKPYASAANHCGARHMAVNTRMVSKPSVSPPINAFAWVRQIRFAALGDDGRVCEEGQCGSDEARE